LGERRGGLILLEKRKNGRKKREEEHRSQALADAPVLLSRSTNTVI